MSIWRKLKPPLLAGLKLGEAGEEWASYLYRKRGCKILARNYEIFWKKKVGEVDIICLDGKRLIMVEVRTRQDERFLDITETINFRKQIYLRRMAKLFMQANPQYENYDLQIDVVAILMDPVDNFVKSVKLIENAIEDSN